MADTWVLHEIEPIAPAWSAIADAAECFLPAERVSVAEAALRHRLLENAKAYRGPWSFELAPYLRRPMETLTDSLYSTTAVQGPAQSGKSEIPNNWLLQAAIYAPAPFVWLQVDKVLMGAYVREKIDTMIELSPDLKARLRNQTDADNSYRKEFRRGMIVNFIWPVPAQMRMRTAPNVVIDDFDDVPQNVGGQGDPLTLLGARQTTHEGKEKSFVGSSPALGVGRGIEALVASGTDERWRVECPQCRDDFVIDFDLLDYDKTGSPAAAEASAIVKCPVHGCIIEPQYKTRVIRSGDWEAFGANAESTDVASFRIDGLMGFTSWPRLARDRRKHEIRLEIHQDEQPLKAFINTKGGKNYKSQIDGRPPVELEDLETRALAGEHELGQVPPDVVCLTAAVDVQGSSFEILVRGWKARNESVIVDRFAMVALEDGMTKIEPATKPEHWQVLLSKVLWRRWPVLGNPEVTLPILNMAIDTGGVDGVSQNAYDFWAAALDLGVPKTALTLIKGGNNPKAKLLPPATTETRASRKGGRAVDVELYVPNVHRFKDMIDMRLRRDKPGPGFIGLPIDMTKAHLAELTAEEKIEGVWVRKEHSANETFDLLVYSEVVMWRLFGSDRSLAEVPAWARPKAIAPPDLTRPPAPQLDLGLTESRKSAEPEPAARPTSTPVPTPAPRRRGPIASTRKLTLH